MTSDLEAVRSATRELHETIKDAKQAKKELEAVRDEIAAAWKKVRNDIEVKIEAEVRSEIEHMNDQIGEAIHNSTDAVYVRFDKIISVMLGLEPSQVPLAEQLSQLHLSAKQRKSLQSIMGVMDPGTTGQVEYRPRGTS